MRARAWTCAAAACLMAVAYGEEAVFKGGADGGLGIRVEASYGLCQNVCGGVPEYVLALVVGEGEELNVCVAVKNVGHINESAVDLGGQNLTADDAGFLRGVKDG